MAIDTSPSQLQQPGPQTLGSNVVSFLGLMLRAQEAKAEAPARAAATRLTAARAAGLEQENTLFDNLQKKLPDLLTEYGQIKTAEDMFNFNAKYANLMATPQGEKILTFLDRQAQKTAAFEIQQANNKRAYDQTLRYGFTGPEATKRDSINELYAIAKDQRRLIQELPDDWFNPDGTINYQKAGPGIGSMPTMMEKVAPGELGFTEMTLPSGHIILQNKATGAGIVIDPTKASVQAHLKAFSAEDSALQKQLTGIENDLLMRVSPEKKAKAIAEVQKQRAAVMEKYLGKMLQEQNATPTDPAVDGSFVTPATTVAPAATPTPTIQQDKALILQDARNALIKGAPRDKVIERLRELGITEEP